MDEETAVKAKESNLSETTQRMAALTMDLIAFAHRVALDEKASPAEIAALPKVAAELCVKRVISTEKTNEVVADLFEFAHRVALDKNASPAEIAALPEIVKVLRDSTWS